MKHSSYILPALFPAILLSTCLNVQAKETTAAPSNQDIAPEYASGLTAQSITHANEYMIATANPIASKAGLEILENGGNAVDAMIAAQIMLNLVEPQSSGLGGGAFAVYWDAKTQKLTTFDGRETAPQNLLPNAFLDDENKPMSFWDAAQGGKAVGVPSLAKLMHELHERHGKTDLHALLKPTIELSLNGFMVSPRLSSSIEKFADKGLTTFPATKDYFFKDGEPLTTEDKLTNVEFAETLNYLADNGLNSFYSPEFYQDIVSKVNSTSVNSGVMQGSDLESYKVIERTPVCMDYRELNVCGMGPPSSGAITIGQILGILENYDLSKYAKKATSSAQLWHLFAEASKLAYADRDTYLADSDFVDIPKGLLDKTYLKSRSELINKKSVLPIQEAGNPAELLTTAYAPDASQEKPGTTHIVVKDAAGNMISMTSTIESAFGSKVMAKGFLLNNEMTDFSFVAEKDGKPIANAIEPGKRPRSSMSPTIILKDNQPQMLIGSPGGSRIIEYVAKTIVAHYDLGMDIQSAINLGNVINRNKDYTEIEDNSDLSGIAKGLEKIGHTLKTKDLTSGVQAIVIDEENKLQGAADPRREGRALGK